MDRIAHGRYRSPDREPDDDDGDRDRHDRERRFDVPLVTATASRHTRAHPAWFAVLGRLRLRAGRLAKPEWTAATGRETGRVIRVPVPLDVGTIVAEGSGAFALATPLRVGELLALAVREALGSRAPGDKLERGIRNTLAGLRAGEFVVDVDGRVFRNADDVVVCSGFAALRFFARRTERSARRA